MLFSTKRESRPIMFSKYAREVHRTQSPCSSDYRRMMLRPCEHVARRILCHRTPPLRMAHSTWSNFQRESKQNSVIERSRILTANDEHGLLEFAPVEEAPCMEASACVHEGASSVVSRFRENGLLRLNNMLPTSDTSVLKHYVDHLLEAGIESVGGTKGTPFLHLFGPVMVRQNRFDVLLPIDKIVLPIVQRIMSHLSNVLIELTGADTCLCELSALVSDPQSPGQPVHHDTALFEGSNRRMSLLVALQDVHEDMGPTIFFPSTNTEEWHINYMNRGKELEDLLENDNHMMGVLNEGDAVLYDTNLLHCGSANRANKRKNQGGIVPEARRTLLVVSVQVENQLNAGDHSNIRPGYRGKFRIVDHAKWHVAVEA